MPNQNLTKYCQNRIFPDFIQDVTWECIILQLCYFFSSILSYGHHIGILRRKIEFFNLISMMYNMRWNVYFKTSNSSQKNNLNPGMKTNYYLNFIRFSRNSIKIHLEQRYLGLNPMNINKTLHTIFITFGCLLVVKDQAVC